MQFIDYTQTQAYSMCMSYFEHFSSSGYIAIQLVFGAKLGIAVHEWKRSAESILMLNIHFPVFTWYIWSKLNKLFKYKKYQLTKRWLEGKLEGFFRVS